MKDYSKSTCTEMAKHYASAKTAATRKEIKLYVEARVQVTHRKAWHNLLADIEAGNNGRVKARSLPRREMNAELKRLRDAEEKPAKASKTPAKAPKAKPTNAPKALEGFSPEELAAAIAFLKAFK
jgi:hypothetical protein